MALATCAVVRLALSEPAQDDQRVDRPRGDLDCFYTFRKSLLLPKPRDVTYRQRKCLSVLACDAFGANLNCSESRYRLAVNALATGRPEGLDLGLQPLGAW